MQLNGNVNEGRKISIVSTRYTVIIAKEESAHYKVISIGGVNIVPSFGGTKGTIYACNGSISN